MRLLIDAVRAVDKSPRAVILYLAFAAAGSGFRSSADSLYQHFFEASSPDSVDRAYVIITTLLFATFSALAASIGFARIGQDMDAPLWRVEGDSDAVRRFFPLWFLLAVPASAAMLLPGWVHETVGSDDLAATVFFLVMLLTIVGFCYAGSVMFFGRVNRHTLRDAFHPLLAQAAQSILVVCFLGMLNMACLLVVLRGGEKRWLWTLLDIIFAYGECVAFAMVWIICIRHRNESLPDTLK